MNGEWSVEMPDGCYWTIDWFGDAEGWYVDVYIDEDDPPSGPCSCAHPEDGVYDSLETVELALGFPIPPIEREGLLAWADANRQRPSERGAWGRVFAMEIIRVDEDGTFWSSFAPTWADDPTSSYWDPDNFPL